MVIEEIPLFCFELTFDGFFRLLSCRLEAFNHDSRGIEAKVYLHMSCKIENSFSVFILFLMCSLYAQVNDSCIRKQ